MAMPRRTWLAFILAPIAAVAALTLVGAAITGASAIQVSYAGFYFAFFGLPIAYAVEALVAMPLYVRYAPSGRLRPALVIGVAVLVGAAVMPLVWKAFFGGVLELRMGGIGAAMGASSGATFVVIAGRELTTRRERNAI